MQTHPLSIQASSEIPSKWDRQIEAAKRFFGIKPRPVVPTKPTLTPKQAADKFLGSFHKDNELVRIGEITPNQVRSKHGLPPFVEGDVYYKPLFKIPEGLSAADYAKGVAKAAENLKDTIARVEIATLSKPTPKTVKGFILDYLEQQGGPVSAFEIYEGIFYPGVIKYGTVTTRISELAKSGQITYTGKITRNGKQVNGYVAAGVK